jgi:hypothetical protein
METATLLEYGCTTVDAGPTGYCMAGEKVSIPDWIKIAIPCVLAIVAAAIWVGTQELPLVVASKVSDATSTPMGKMQSTLDRMAERGDDLGRRVDRIESKLDSLYTDALQKLLDRAKNDSTPDAKAKIVVAQGLLENATKQKVPAAEDFFKEQVAALSELRRNPDLIQNVRSFGLALADYRSSQQSGYVIPKDAVPVKPPPGFSAMPYDLYRTPDGWVIWDNSRTNSEEDMLVPRSELKQGAAPTPPWKVRMYVTRQVLIGGAQTLDGSVWQDVVFSNARIRYHGGPLLLNRVAFLNCTFDLSMTSPGTDTLARFLALGSPGTQTIN